MLSAPPRKFTAAPDLAKDGGRMELSNSAVVSVEEEDGFEAV